MVGWMVGWLAARWDEISAVYLGVSMVASTVDRRVAMMAVQKAVEL